MFFRQSSRRFVAGLVAVFHGAMPMASVAAEPTGEASPPSVEAERSAGVEAYQRGDHEAALDHFSRAYETEPAPELLYAMAQSERALGRCDRAIPLYERFVEQAGSAERRGAAEANLERCRQALAKVVAPPPEDSQSNTATPKPEARRLPSEATSKTTGDEKVSPRANLARAPEPDRSSPAWHRDPLGGTLVATGTALGAIGTVLWLQAGGEEESAREDAGAPSRGDYQSTIDDFNAINRKRQTSRVMVLGGGVLVGFGVWRYLSLAGERTDVVLSGTELRVRVGGTF